MLKVGRRSFVLLGPVMAAALMCPMLSGCKSDKAKVEEGLTAQLDLLKAPTRENVEAAVGEEYKGQLATLADGLSEQGIDLYELMGHALRLFDYEITNVKVSGDIGTATVSITSINVGNGMHAALEDFESESNKSQVEQLYREGGQKSVMEFYASLLYAQLDAVDELVTTKVEVGVTKTDGHWKVVDDSMGAIISAVLGGLDTSALQTQ